MTLTLSRLLIALTLVAAPLIAGCTDDGGSGDDDGTTGGDGDGGAPADAYALTAAGVPANVAAGDAFTFTLTISGNANRSSDHIGAHYGNESTDAPSTDAYPEACAHTAGNVPGSFNVTCTIPDAGTYYLRGHLRVDENGTLTNYWTDEEFEVTVTSDGAGNGGDDGTPEFELLATGIPTVVSAGDAFTFTLFVNGTEDVDTDHIGAHYGNESTNAPSTDAYPEACAHTTGTVPGTFEVTCSFTRAGTHYVRGHVRVDVDGELVNYWTDDEYAVTVRPEYAVTVTGVPAAAIAGEAFNFTVNVTGNGTFPTEHVDAHYGNESTDTPTTLVYDQACDGAEGEVPGEFEVSCTIEEPGTYYLRGHVRVTIGEHAFNYWTEDEFLVVVA